MKKTIPWRSLLTVLIAVVLALACSKKPTGPSSEKAFATPEEAASALITAAADYDVPALVGILGRDGRDLVVSGDPVQDKNRALAFAAKAREKNAIERDADDSTRATLVVGNDRWPLPIPLVATGGRWSFDTRAGYDEIQNRRIGENELTAISICRGYVEAQREYASEKHDDASVNQYAQRLLSTPGKNDGLAWQNPDGSWGGPVGEEVARAIEQGYSAKKPFHGYYFKILKGQGPAARLGRLDYVIDGAMVGGFALLAWPAEYGMTGVQTFMVSYDGLVVQKDLGEDTPKIASAIELYDPDASWKRTDDAV